MRRSVILLFAAAAAVVSPAQDTWTLQQCIGHALEHNISIKQYANQLEQREIDVNTAKNSRLPDVSASAGQNFSFGRGLTADNTYTNTNTSSTSFSLGTSVPLFTGFQIPNQIKLSRLNLQAATADLEKARNDISMQVAQAYVQILYDKEILAVARRQIGIDSLQLFRLQQMMDNGKASGAEVSQQRSAMAQSELTATQAESELRMALLSLSQLLEFPSPEGFDIAAPDTAAFSSAELTASPDEIFQAAVGIRPEIRAEMQRLEGSETSIDIARAALYPQLSFSAGLGSNAYHTSGYETDGFMKQLKNNFSQYVGLNLSIPIFNRFQTRNSVRQARLNRDAQQLQLDNAKKSLYKEIQQVYYNALSARQKYRSSDVARQSSEDAFTLMRAKYENGRANITEFNEAKNNFMKAESDLVQSRYEYLYQLALLRFYKGEEIRM